MRAILFAFAVFALAACGNDAGTGDAVEADPANLAQAFEKRAAENLAASKKFLDENAGREDVKTTESGLQYMVLEEGPEDGASPNPINVIDVEYVGTLTDGVEFDSSYARGAAARFRLDAVIPGWTEGLQLMSEGDHYRFFIPPELAYGERGDAPGGPNQALIFDVKLLKVHDLLRNKKEAEAFFEKNANKEGVIATRSGLQYKVLSEGSDDGASPTEDSTITVHYRGELINGTEFDSSYARGEPDEFKLGRVAVAGWVEGVQMMNEGDKYRFFIPPKLAYGEEGTPGGPIAPNEALIFDVELIEVK